MTAEATMAGMAARSRSDVVRGLTIGLIATLGLAANDVAIPMGYRHPLTSTALLALRYVFLIAVLLVLLPLLRRRLALPAGRAGWAVAAGALSCLGSLGLITAFAFIPIGLALLIVYLYPILTAMLQGLVDRERVGALQFLCLVVAFAGLGIALGFASGGIAPGTNVTGLLSAFGGAFGFAGYFVVSRLGLSGTEPIATTLYTSTAGLVLAAAAGAVIHATGLMPLQVPPLSDGTGWMWVLIISAAFAIAYFGMFRATQLIGATPTAMLMNLETVFAMPLAAVFLGEALTAERLAGAAMVLGAVAVSQWVGA